MVVVVLVAVAALVLPVQLVAPVASAVAAVGFHYHRMQSPHHSYLLHHF